MNYLKRKYDAVLERKVKSSGAVLIEGPKWCGKTTTALQIARSVLYMQKPDEVRQNIEMSELDPGRLLIGDTPRLIDEWQIAPNLWDAIRYEVDMRNDFSQFILTGSSVPADFSRINHSGTGRITRMLMHTMSLHESGESNGQVSLAALFRGDEKLSGKNELDLQRLAFLICRGGWPRAIGEEDEIALMLPENYYEGVVNSDINRVDGVTKAPEKVKRLMRSYAKNICSQAKSDTIIREIRGERGNEELSKMTVNSYINALKKIFVIEDASAWNPSLRSKTTVRASDTRYFTDPSIGIQALGLGPQDLLDDLTTMGLFFENMCIRDLRVYADLLGGTVYHYKDRNNLECDAVIHLKNGKYGLIEIKLGGDKLIEEGAETLLKLANKINEDVMKAPAFRMVLTGTGTYAYQRKDGIFIVPIGCLRE